MMYRHIYDVCFIDYEKAFDRVNHDIRIVCVQQIATKGRCVNIGAMNIINLRYADDTYCVTG